MHATASDRARPWWAVTAALVALLALLIALPRPPAAPSRSGASPTPTQLTADVAVYGATPSGVMAAVAAARAGADVVLVERSARIGGMVTAGLGATDVANPGRVGGLTREFYRRVGDEYEVDRYGLNVAWYHEPSVAAAVFDALVEEAGLRVVASAPLDREAAPQMDGRSIRSVRLETGTEVAARVFVDATYEGDLLAVAGVPFVVGREAAARYGEPLAGVTPPVPPPGPVADIDGRDGDGLPLPGIGALGAPPGSADGLVQPFNFRLCVTDDPARRLPFPVPDGYDPDGYPLLRRVLEAWSATPEPPDWRDIVKITPLPNRTGDLNNAGVFSTDLLTGVSASWATAADDERDAIRAVHRDYQQGLLHYLSTEPTVPDGIRSELRRWGLCAGEFRDGGGWPPELYVRQARRMVGDRVLVQHDLQDDLEKPDSIGIGTYRIDAHAARLVLDERGFIRAEGELNAATRPYEIPYAILVPPRSATDNLLVSAAVSASHVAFSSLRMEVNFMTMGEAAGVAAAIAADRGLAVGDVPYADLVAELERRSPVLER